MREWLIGGGILISMSVLVGYCVKDYVGSVQQTVDATIIGKDYRPGHYDTHCSYDHDKGRNDCSTDWVPPSWSVAYADEAGSHSTGVNQGTYEILWVGQRVYVTFWEGQVFGFRYSERFSTERPRSLEHW